MVFSYASARRESSFWYWTLYFYERKQHIVLPDPKVKKKEPFWHTFDFGLTNFSVGSLGHSFKLWGLGWCHMMSDYRVDQPVLKVVAAELSSSIRGQDFYLLGCLSLHICSGVLECSRYFGFMFD